jgi:hypothetical protein
MVEETFEPGMTVSLVARRHGVAPREFIVAHELPSPCAVVRELQHNPVSLCARQSKTLARARTIHHLAVRRIRWWTPAKGVYWLCTGSVLELRLEEAGHQRCRILDVVDNVLPRAKLS